jgi:hypothetical protein
VGVSLKNPTIGNNTNSVMPIGPTVDREANPTVGSFRFNTDARSSAGAIEIFDGVKWEFISVAGLAAVIKDSFAGDSFTTSFTMSRLVPTAYDVVVFIGNVHQNPDVSYTVDGNILNFSSPPPMRNTVVVLHGLNNTSA